MPESTESLGLRLNQYIQIIDQYRTTIYTLELKQKLLVKMMEEKGYVTKGEFDNRWPQYLKNDVGVMGPDGKMEGNVLVNFYGCK